LHLRFLEQVAVQTEGHRGIAVTHALGHGEQIDAQVDRDGRMGVSQVVSPERVGQAGFAKRRADDLSRSLSRLSGLRYRVWKSGSVFDRLAPLPPFARRSFTMAASWSHSHGGMGIRRSPAEVLGGPATSPKPSESNEWTGSTVWLTWMTCLAKSTHTRSQQSSAGRKPASMSSHTAGL
jgi:hypothetical protein